MNINPKLPTDIAIIIALSGAFLWGTWFVSIKYLVDYSLDGFFVTLFTTSFIFVWAIGYVLDGHALFSNIQEVYITDPSRITITLACGAIYVIGFRISFYVFNIIGLSISQPMRNSMNVLIGTLVSAVVGGIPKGLSVPKLIVACILLTTAIISSLIAGNLHTHTSSINKTKSRLIFSSHDLRKSLGLIVLASGLSTGYSFGISYGLVSVSHPFGLSVMPFMAVLVTGATIGAFCSSGVVLTLRHQWGRIIHAGMSKHKIGIIAGILHYSGNIIHTFATANLSSVVSWPLGATSGLWTQVWGLIYGEFQGASRRAYIALFTGIVLYLAGAYLISTIVK
jgi:hypothetical protein